MAELSDFSKTKRDRAEKKASRALAESDKLVNVLLTEAEFQALSQGGWSGGLVQPHIYQNWNPTMVRIWAVHEANLERKMLEILEEGKKK